MSESLREAQERSQAEAERRARDKGVISFQSLRELSVDTVASLSRFWFHRNRGADFELM
jgi:hypothetical protein